MYFITIVLQKEHTKGLREMLVEDGFSLYQVNTIINRYTEVNNHSKEETADKITPFNNTNYVQYHCIYNGENLPPTNLIEILQNPLIVKCCINKE